MVDPGSTDLFFSDYFGVEPEVLARYGAFDISVVADLPLFIDPFLIFHSERPEYQGLHRQVLEYLLFLRDKASAGLDPHQIANWYCFKEVKQNWLGFTAFGNRGSGLGMKFATSLRGAFGEGLSSFGEETITAGSHLEKLALIAPGVGRDNISDFTTNLIKDYLLEFTQRFALEHLHPDQRSSFPVTRAAFDYVTESWQTRTYVLPRLDDDFVLLTPTDLLTRDDTWINHNDMVGRLTRLPAAISDGQLRAQINNYLTKTLGTHPSRDEIKQASVRIINEFPELIDYYIKSREASGDQAVAHSATRVSTTQDLLVHQVRSVIEGLIRETGFYSTVPSSYEEALSRVMMLKQFIEDKDGYRLINPGRDRRPSREADVQLLFGLVWMGSRLDVNREVNNGRGPVDFKVSFGAHDKGLVEFKLASNSQLKRNLQHQVGIYEKANDTRRSIKVIVYYTAAEQRKVEGILTELNLSASESVVVIDARADNKPSASKAS